MGLVQIEKGTFDTGNAKINEIFWEILSNNYKSGYSQSSILERYTKFSEVKNLTQKNNKLLLDKLVAAFRSGNLKTVRSEKSSRLMVILEFKGAPGQAQEMITLTHIGIIIPTESEYLFSQQKISNQQILQNASNNLVGNLEKWQNDFPKNNDGGNTKSVV